MLNNVLVFMRTIFRGIISWNDIVITICINSSNILPIIFPFCICGKVLKILDWLKILLSRASNFVNKTWLFSHCCNWIGHIETSNTILRLSIKYFHSSKIHPFRRLFMGKKQSSKDMAGNKNFKMQLTFQILIANNMFC